MISVRNKESSWVRQYGPTAVFFLLTLAGCAGIWTAKTIGLNTVYVTLAPVALMFVYFALAFLASGLRLHDEQTGDNLYYMGFLFTLTSLGASLYQYEAASSIDDIVRNFGVAITSTITGIGLRIFYNQMRRDPLDIERTVRHELAESARRVRAEMDSAAQEFAFYRRTSSQMLQEGFEEIAKQASSSGESVRGTLDSIVSKSIQPLVESASQLQTLTKDSTKSFEALLKGETERLASTAMEFTKVGSGIAGALAELNKQISSAGRRLSKMVVPEETIRVELEPAFERFGQIIIEHIGELEKLNERQRNDFSNVLRQLSVTGQLVQRMETVATLLERSAVAMEAMNQNAPRISFGSTYRPPSQEQPSHLPERAPSQEEHTPGTWRGGWRPWQK